MMIASTFQPCRQSSKLVATTLTSTITIFVIFALTGFVCTYKIQAEEECLSSNVLCYECDSRYDPNCADPFELSSLSLTDQQKQQQQQQSISSAQSSDNSPPTSGVVLENRQQPSGNSGNNSLLRPPKKFPNAFVCHGCCVKITSKTPEGATYVKRTCTTNLQINYFMVGLVCMKESGDRGKMCFCETDYCNGTSTTNLNPLVFSIFIFVLTMITSIGLWPIASLRPTKVNWLLDL